MEEKRKRIILIGRSTAGKTTLCQRINHEDLAYHKTQTVQIVNQTMIDTPGEYLERRYFRGALMVTATDADFIVLVQDATENGTMFPPAYNTQFAKLWVWLRRATLPHRNRWRRRRNFCRWRAQTKYLSPAASAAKESMSF